ncbi:Na(+)-translocating NADH-quinone reductase subunit A [Porphyromonas sp.]|uniref:Na(+)-translocating NADH-quinone reductase subunit A n=1 Tax=Porphyromonas sp. TaxID=1924944 RepID=UPI0026DCA404|nr:Na(+)-translocating NADH-quinone reductase subunit A [Porphyromonas sp.]MDO4695700.1 Na(+)-translocating NADH-quinone reductase subunit A [Porphyromonas sp.]MDO4771828.1 Na(+)-translocating NADH-quinone reductase subunit A [Porphyromonas sp.]
MANVIKIKKGLDINLKGKPSEVDVPVSMGTVFGVVPDHYPGFVPKLSIKAGDRVKAGTPILYHKSFPQLVVTAPVSGEVVEVRRGLKRKIMSIDIKADATIEYEHFDNANVSSMSAEEVKALLLKSGMLALVRQRPYDYVINPEVTPRDIFVTAQMTAPLTPDVEYLVKGQEQYLQVAIDALAKLTTGSVYVGVKSGSALNLSNCKVYEVSGPHPAGNVGVLINHTVPVNKGETVWTLSATELLIIGRFLSTGKVDMTKKVAFVGPRMEKRGYADVIAGADINSLISDKLGSNTSDLRVIDGNVLTGTQVTEEYKYMSPYSNLITAMNEGADTHEMFGWALPGFGKFSMSRSFPTFLMGKNKEYDIDARIRGGQRAIIVSNEYDKVFPMDIYPEYLLKAIITFDIDKMENLGIYEVAPEDFALCEFVDTSKLEIQYIVRKGLDELYKEMH